MTDTPEPPSMSFSSSSGASNILSEKVQRGLQVRTDTPAMKAALEALARLPDSGEMDSRSVRVAIERDALQQALLLQQELTTLLSTVSSLRQGVADVARIANDISLVIHSNVVNPNNTSEDALEEELRLATLLSDAFQEQQHAKQRAETVHAFLEKFNLDPHHEALLDQYDFSKMDNTEGMHFLDALERVCRIRQELSTQDVFSPEQRLGATSAIRMMESLAAKQERAYERLYHWLQSYLHLNPSQSSSSLSQEQQQLDTDAAMEEALSHPFVRRSLQTLKHVPAFYSHMLELIATSRRVQVTRKFLLALTSGYDGQAPMEVKAHDPIAYVGDMLAFCFQSCSIEADNVRHIVVLNEHDNDQDDTTMVEHQSTMLSAEEMLAHAMSGIARPLKSRILQVVASLARKEGEDDDESDTLDEDEEDAIARSRVSSLYNICGLLLFYHSALLKCVHKETTNPLVTAVMECLNEASEAYAASLRVYAAMLDSLAIITGESDASLAQSLLGQLVEVRTTSPGFAAHVECPSDSLLSLEFMTTTLLQAALSSCKTLDDAVTLKVCISTAKKAGLTSFQQLEELVGEKEQSMIEGLVDEKTVQVLELCGLGTMATAWNNMLDVEGMTMASTSGLTEEDIELGMKEFYSSLYAPPLPTFETIKDPVLRRLARSKICDNVVRVYEELYTAMHSEKGGYEDLSFLGHTPEQVKTLFSA